LKAVRRPRYLGSFPFQHLSQKPAKSFVVVYHQNAHYFTDSPMILCEQEICLQKALSTDDFSSLHLEEKAKCGEFAAGEELMPYVSLK
jgi:hypothetical protein